MKKLFFILVAALLTSNAFGSELESFCARITSLSFKESAGRIHAYGHFDRFRTLSETDTLLQVERIRITDPKVIFKLAKVVSQLTIQDSEQLQKDLQNSQFEWDHLVGDELHPNPYEEDFETCLAADLSQLSKGSRSLSQISKILDVREDGYSVIDLLD